MNLVQQYEILLDLIDLAEFHIAEPQFFAG